MPQSNLGGLIRPGGFPEKGVAQVPACFLGRQALLFLPDPHIHFSIEEGNSQLPGCLADKIGLSFSLGAKAMVQVGYNHRKVKISPRLPEGMEKSHGICPSRDSDYNFFSGLEHPVFSNGLL
jgi:hypothetical protein